MEFLKLFVPIEKMPAQVAFIAGLIIIIICIMLLAYFAYKIYAKIKIRIKL